MQRNHQRTPSRWSHYGIIGLKILFYPFGIYAAIKSAKSIINIFSFRKVPRSFFRVVGAASGAYGGVIAGGTIGSLFPVVGTLLGSIVGGLLGSSIGAFLAKQIARGISYWYYTKKQPDIINPTSPEGWEININKWGGELKRSPRYTTTWLNAIYTAKKSAVTTEEKQTLKDLRDMIVNKDHPDRFESSAQPIPTEVNDILTEYRKHFFSNNDSDEAETPASLDSPLSEDKPTSPYDGLH